MKSDGPGSNSRRALSPGQVLDLSCIPASLLSVKWRQETPPRRATIQQDSEGSPAGAGYLVDIRPSLWPPNSFGFKDQGPLPATLRTCCCMALPSTSVVTVTSIPRGFREALGAGGCGGCWGGWNCIGLFAPGLSTSLPTPSTRVAAALIPDDTHHGSQPCEVG